MIACGCPVCLSVDPKNKRFRSSILIESNAGVILVDTTPEMRLQLLRERTDRLAGVLLTHAHADHIHGLDDLRQLCFAHGLPIDIYASRQTLERIRHVFDYCFKETGPCGGKPKLNLVPLEHGKPFQLAGLDVTPTAHMHGILEVTSYTINNRFAYCSDVSFIPEATKDIFKRCEVVVLGAVRPDSKPHPSHFVLPEALSVLDELRTPLGLITHLSHSFDHSLIDVQIPIGRHLAYDGLLVRMTTTGASLHDSPNLNLYGG